MDPLSLPHRGKMKLLFLQSHGLRTHLSAIRWAAGRLRKSSESLSKEQKHLVSEIVDHTKILTSALNAMLLLGRAEEQDHTWKAERIDLTELLRSLSQTPEHRRTTWMLSLADGLSLQTDRLFLDAILRNLFLLCDEGASEPRRVFVTAQSTPQDITVLFSTSWQLPFVTTGSSESGQADRLLGGTPGLLLSLASALARFAGGSLSLEEAAWHDDELVHDGTVERHADEQVGEHRIVLLLPRKL